MQATPDSPRMFDSDWLDALSRTPWWTVPLMWLPVSAGCLLVARDMPLPHALGAAAIGWFVWTLVEYSLHRWPFHWQPATSWGPRLHFLVHGVHHQWHRDRYRLVMPPAVSLLLCAVLGPLFRVALGGYWFWPFFAGFVFGYTVYDLSHYAFHHLKVKNPLFQRLKRHHLLHHHSPQHADRKFGVSTTLWDHVFRTF